MIISEVSQKPQQVHEYQTSSDRSSEVAQQASLLFSISKGIQATLSAVIPHEWETETVVSVDYHDDQDYGLCEVSIRLQNGTSWWINPPLVFFIGEKVQYKTFSVDSEEYKKGWRHAIKAGNSVFMQTENNPRAYSI